MKRGIIFLVLILMAFPLISSLNFELKENFSQGETFLAKISGDFATPLTEQNIAFYRRHLQTSIIPKIIEIDKEFYIYAPLEGKIPDNYSINIGEDSKNFTILNEIADFSIDRGFVVADKDFSIEIKNLKESEISVKSKFNQEENSYNLEDKETEKINFGISKIKETSLQYLELNSENLTYKIPVYVFVIASEIPEETATENQTLENKTEEIKPVEIEKITSVSTTQTCSEMNGTICKKDIEKCNNNSAYAKGAVCCLGTCEQITENKSWKILGWSLFIVVILVVWVVLAKYKKVKSTPDLLRNLGK